MEYIYPKHLRLSKKDREKARRIFELLAWFFMGTVTVYTLLRVFVWIIQR